MKRSDIWREIKAERERQSRQWGDEHAWGEGDCSSHLVAPIVKAAVLNEECGEVARAVLDRDEDEIVNELIQVAAVAVAWLESL